ncbi:hypothetical protein L596_001721 [Steinernema carpocapsae]|uniref:Uncharacterized protein n=1 Tax=Steinernema carpocapsae TaxID=34508 RepID=A0A4U8UMC6_STECR|nr:hypothetical protein L596_001721 [Steinernema carpocapsae]
MGLTDEFECTISVGLTVEPRVPKLPPSRPPREMKKKKHKKHGSRRRCPESTLHSSCPCECAAERTGSRKMLQRRLDFLFNEDCKNFTRQDRKSLNHQRKVFFEHNWNKVIFHPSKSIVEPSVYKEAKQKAGIEDYERDRKEVALPEGYHISNLPEMLSKDAVILTEHTEDILDRYDAVSDIRIAEGVRKVLAQVNRVARMQFDDITERLIVGLNELHTLDPSLPRDFYVKQFMMDESSVFQRLTKIHLFVVNNGIGSAQAARVLPRFVMGSYGLPDEYM